MRRNALKSRHVWSEDDLIVLRATYADYPTEVVALMVGCSKSTVYRKAHSLGLTKSDAFLAGPDSGRITPETGRSTRFQKGITPWNKGSKGLCLGGQQTQFKKGTKPPNYMPIGSERLQDGYLLRKLYETGYPPHDWVPVHRLLWEETNGPIPPNHVLIFRDGNKAHIAIDNLEVISRTELMARNTIHNLPPELKAAVDAKRMLTRAINQWEKKHV